MTRLTASKRFFLGLVAAFATAGVFVAAQDLEKPTIAGPSKELDPLNGCPPEYPIIAFVKPGNIIDANQDGKVCTDSKEIVYVDNDYNTNPSDGPRHVSGHGNIESHLQNISFSFHGIGIEGSGPGASEYDAKGKFEFHDQNLDLRVHGDVICLRVDGNMATLIGIVTRTNDDGLPFNSLAQWTTEDNGEGSNAEPDVLSRPARIRVRNTPDCQFQPTKLTGFEILSGNIQVDEDETSGGKPTALEEKDLNDEESESWGLSGFGNFLDEGKKVVQDISFSFHAIGSGPDGKFIENTATGKFEYADLTPGGMGLSVAGEVVCATVSSKSAMLVGVVTKSNDKGLPLETLVTWSAEDKDDDGVSQDRISRLAPIGVKLPKGLCSGKVPAPIMKEVLSGGNILVK